MSWYKCIAKNVVTYVTKSFNKLEASQLSIKNVT